MGQSIFIFIHRLVITLTFNPDTSRQTQKPLFIFGAGGHGRVVADAALLQCAWVSVLAGAHSLSGLQTELLPGVRLIELDAVKRTDAEVHIAIGNNAARQSETHAFDLQRLVCVIHPSASVSNFSQMGAGCFVAAGAVVAPAATLGQGVIVNHGAVIDHDTEIGDFSQRASVCGHAKLGQRVLIGSGAIVLSSVVLGDDVVLSPGSIASCHLLEPGLYSGIPAVKIQ